MALTPLAPTQVLPQRAAFLAIPGDALMDALVTDRHFAMAGDLVGTPVLAKIILDPQPRGWVDARLVATLLAGIAPQLATDGAVGSADLLDDLPERETCLFQPLNLVAFVLAQVRIAHVQHPLG